MLQEIPSSAHSYKPDLGKRQERCGSLLLRYSGGKGEGRLSSDGRYGRKVDSIERMADKLGRLK